MTLEPHRALPAWVSRWNLLGQDHNAFADFGEPDKATYEVGLQAAMMRLWVNEAWPRRWEKDPLPVWSG